jgi:nucleoporin NUP82
MLAVYETIDLGLVSTLGQISSSPGDPPLLDLLQGNHPVFITDPIHDDTVYVYHAFGVHTLDIGPVLQSLAIALRAEDDSSLGARVQNSAGTSVNPILTTFSVERRSTSLPLRSNHILTKLIWLLPQMF